MSVFSGSIINQRIGEERRKRRRRQSTQQAELQPEELARQEQERQRKDGGGNGWLYRQVPMEFRLEGIPKEKEFICTFLFHRQHAQKMSN